MDEDDRDAKQGDPDRAAILARRRRFIALAISGLATAGCKRPSPQPCLNRLVQPDPSDSEDPDDPDATPSEPGPFVEDPGEPLESETGEGETGEGVTDTGELMPVDSRPNVCLNVAAPKPCLKKKPSPRTCLLMID